MNTPNPQTPVPPLLTNSSAAAPGEGDQSITPHPMRRKTDRESFVSSTEPPTLSVGHALHKLPGGTNGVLYFRYQVWAGHKVVHSIHIPGGNVSNPIAQQRAIAVEKAIARGQSADSILKMIRGWKTRKVKEAQLSLL